MSPFVRLVGGLAVLVVVSAHATEPPYDGTVWLDPDLIMPGDETTHDDHPGGQGIKHEGSHSRLMMVARNPDRWETLNVHLYRAWYGTHIPEIQVNPLFQEGEARRLAQRYADMLGQLPRVLREAVDEIEINPGDHSASGFHRGWACSVYLYTDMMEAEWNSPFAEEIIAHEAAHCLEDEHRDTSGWRAAQGADPGFISSHAQNYPHREDFAETFSAWMAVRYRPGRLDDGIAETIGDTIPHRLAYLDGAIPEEDMAPFAKSESPSALLIPYIPRPGQANQGFFSFENYGDAEAIVSLRLYDEHGTEVSLASVSLPAGITRWLNSTDLAHGNTGKGVSVTPRGTARGSSLWARVQPNSDRVLVLAYVRSSSGFVTAMSRTAAAWQRESNNQWLAVLPFFNPGANKSQSSMLRLINPTGQPRAVRVDAWDNIGDRGRSTVRCTLPTYGVISLKVAALEAGPNHPDCTTDGWGDGTGKWWVQVEDTVLRDDPLIAMALLHSTGTGLVTNVSAPALTKLAQADTPPPPPPGTEFAPADARAFFEHVEGKRLVLQLTSGQSAEVRFTSQHDDGYLGEDGFASLTVLGQVSNTRWRYTKRSLPNQALLEIFRPLALNSLDCSIDLLFTSHEAGRISAGCTSTVDGFSGGRGTFQIQSIF